MFVALAAGRNGTDTSTDAIEWFGGGLETIEEGVME